MSDLSAGGGTLPVNWGYPSSTFNYCTGAYESGGMIWYGEERATLEDVVELINCQASTPGIDKLSICGTNDPAWTTERDVKLAANENGCYKPTIILG